MSRNTWSEEPAEGIVRELYDAVDDMCPRISRLPAGLTVSCEFQYPQSGMWKKLVSIVKETSATFRLATPKGLPYDVARNVVDIWRKSLPALEKPGVGENLAEDLARFISKREQQRIQSTDILREVDVSFELFHEFVLQSKGSGSDVEDVKLNVIVMAAAILGAAAVIYAYRKKSVRTGHAYGGHYVPDSSHVERGGYLVLTWSGTSGVDVSSLSQTQHLQSELIRELDKWEMFRYFNNKPDFDSFKGTVSSRNELNDGEYFVGVIHDTRGVLDERPNRRTLRKLAQNNNPPRFEFGVVSHSQIEKYVFYGRNYQGATTS